MTVELLDAAVLQVPEPPSTQPLPNIGLASPKSPKDDGATDSRETSDKQCNNSVTDSSDAAKPSHQDTINPDTSAAQDCSTSNQSKNNDISPTAVELEAFDPSIPLNNNKDPNKKIVIWGGSNDERREAERLAKRTGADLAELSNSKDLSQYTDVIINAHGTFSHDLDQNGQKELFIFLIQTTAPKKHIRQMN